MSVFLLLTLHLTTYTIYLFPFERPKKLIGARVVYIVVHLITVL